MIQQIHLQNGLVDGHGLDGEALGAHHMELVLLFHMELRQLRLHDLRPQVLGQAGLVLADAALDETDSPVDGAPHVTVGILGLGTEQGAVGGADGQLHGAAVFLFHGKGHKCVRFLREVPVELTDLLLGVLLNGVVQRDLLAGECELHIGCSFLGVRNKGSGRDFPLSLSAL